VHLLAVAVPTTVTIPVVLAGRWLVNRLEPERPMELALLVGCGAATLGVFLVLVRFVGLRLTAGDT
jgi:hypothetical protein